jgi:hypothetical protein
MYKIRACEQMKKYILTMAQTKQENTIIRQKQSPVHKFPSGVVILSHVCGVAAIVHPLKKNYNFYLANVDREARNSCLLLVKYELEVVT